MLLGLLLGTAGCASTSASAARSAAEGSVVEFSEGGQAFTIISDRYLANSGVPGETPSERRNAFYSVARENGLIKVATDERIAALIAALDERGADGAALEGDAPADGAAYLEIRIGDRVRYVPKPSTANPSSVDRTALAMFTGFKIDVVSVFNELQGFQNVSADNIEFEQPVLSPRLMQYVSGRAR